MVNGDKVREEWQNVLYLEQFTVMQELHGSFHVFLFFHNMAGYTKNSGFWGGFFVVNSPHFLYIKVFISYLFSIVKIYVNVTIFASLKAIYMYQCPIH